MEKTKAEIINEVIKDINGDRIPSLFFMNDELEYTDYWYNDANDSLETEIASLSLCDYDKESINGITIDKILSELENKVIEMFQKKYGITLIPYSD